MNTGILPGGKDGRCVGLRTLPPSCADYLEILEPQLPRTPKTSRPVAGKLYLYLITYSECVFVALVIQHAKHMRLVVTSFVASLAPPHFYTLSHKRYDFQRRKKR
jgi:hypothetical protein